MKKSLTNTKMNMRTETFDMTVQTGNFCAYSNRGTYSF